ncbi:MAG: tRNA (adenosine(37)-N6)-dimethylallyltransferase MiaA [Pseudomonadota bacterium]
MIEIFPDKPILIAGPTASGKSALALHIAETQGGVIVNADALQVFDGWRIVTARPPDPDLARAAHHLYGHVALDGSYSVGHWLREVAPFFDGPRPIIVGGTGLYLSALTEGLADIPTTPAEVRARGNALSLPELLSALDATTRERIDIQNRARVQRAWEVLQTTGRALATWQDETPPPLLPLTDCTPIVLDAPKEWLTPRIAKRFDMMLDEGALDEAARILPHWDPAHQSAKAIGAPELIAHLNGELSLEEAKDRAVISSTQYAKRQRTWFNKRMRAWEKIHMPSTELSTAFTFHT